LGYEEVVIVNDAMPIEGGLSSSDVKITTQNADTTIAPIAPSALSSSSSNASDDKLQSNASTTIAPTTTTTTTTILYPATKIMIILNYMILLHRLEDYGALRQVIPLKSFV